MAWTKVCIHMYARSYRRFDASPVTVTCLSHHSDGVMGVYDAALSAVMESHHVTSIETFRPTHVGCDEVSWFAELTMPGNRQHDTCS